MAHSAAVVLLAVSLFFAIPDAAAAEPVSVGLPGSFQDELGCSGDWQPDCVATQLVFDAGDGVWQGTWTVPAGAYEYKAALDGSWDENYGANAQRDGANIPLVLTEPTAVKFYYDNETHWITDNVNSVIATAVGSFQSEMGCAGDWDPGCLRSWLQDPDGDGIHIFITDAIPPGAYEAKVAIDESWDENYGAGGVANGPNIAFTVATSPAYVTFSYDETTHVMTITVEGEPPPDVVSVTMAGSFQDELGCPGDWQPDCGNTHLGYDTEDDVWQGSWNIPGGSWEYKAALNDSWTENYGSGAQRDGPNIPLELGGPTTVRFYYDHNSHWVTDNVNSVIATAVGSFQSEVGCGGDWDPGCLRSWLQDPDGDGIYTFLTTGIPPGSYEAKVAIDEGWDENYGADGIPNGPNIPFFVTTAGSEALFEYDAATHILTITVEGAVAVESATWGGLKSLYR